VTTGTASLLTEQERKRKVLGDPLIRREKRGGKKTILRYSTCIALCGVVKKEEEGG